MHAVLALLCVVVVALSQGNDSAIQGQPSKAEMTAEIDELRNLVQRQHNDVQELQLVVKQQQDIMQKLIKKGKRGCQ